LPPPPLKYFCPTIVSFLVAELLFETYLRDLLSKIKKLDFHFYVIILLLLFVLQLFTPKKKLENGSAVVSFVNVDLKGNISVLIKNLSFKVDSGKRSSYRAIKRKR